MNRLQNFHTGRAFRDRKELHDLLALGLPPAEQDGSRRSLGEGGKEFDSRDCYKLSASDYLDIARVERQRALYLGLSLLFLLLLAGVIYLAQS